MHPSHWTRLRAFGLLLGIATSLAALNGCARHEQETEPQPAKENQRVKHDAQGNVVVTVNAETQKTIGLQVATLTAMQLDSEIKAYGRVLDPGPLGSLINEFQAATVARAQSHQELERTKVLASQNNASQRAFKEAEAVYMRDELGVRAVLVKAQAAWGKKMADLINSLTASNMAQNAANPLPVELAEREVVLVRVELAPDDAPSAQPPARLLGLGANAVPFAAQFFDVAPALGSQMQGTALLFTATNHENQLLPGMALSAFVTAQGGVRAGVLVPRSAVVRLEGRAWIYLQTGAEEFRRVEITTDEPVANGWFVRQGVAADQKAVIIGAQQLLSEEFKGEGID
jgi:hypothetical protein